MEQLSANFNENVRWFNEVLGVGRSCDLVNRDLVIGGRRARIWGDSDGFGGDAILERIGSFWLSISPRPWRGSTGCRRLWTGSSHFWKPMWEQIRRRSPPMCCWERRCCWWRASRARR